MLPEDASRDAVACVANILHQHYPKHEKHKERLIFEICYYVRDEVVSAEDRAELITKLVLNLQRRIPMEGMSGPQFPDKFERGWVKKAIEFLESDERELWRRWHAAMLVYLSLVADCAQWRTHCDLPRIAALMTREEPQTRAILSR